MTRFEAIAVVLLLSGCGPTRAAASDAGPDPAAGSPDGGITNNGSVTDGSTGDDGPELADSSQTTPAGGPPGVVAQLAVGECQACGETTTTGSRCRPPAASRR